MGALVVAHGVTCELSSGRVLFTRLNLALPAGITGLVGANGVGKTCLARMLAGELAPASGNVQRHCAVTLLPQREVAAACTVADYLAGHDVHSAAGDALLDGIAPDTPCNILSGGQWMRVRLARTLDAGFLILDEPTNDLDYVARATVADFLRRRAGGTLLISHDRECLQLCADILELSNRGLAACGGGWAEYLAARDAERQRLDEALESARRERDRVHTQSQQDAQRRSRQQGHARARAARGGMPKLLLGMRKRNAQATAGRFASAAIDKSAQAVRTAQTALAAIKLQPVMYAGITGRELPAQRLVAAAQGFNIRHRDWIYAQDLQFSWRGNLRLAIHGANGAGKSSLLRMLDGATQLTRGHLHRGELRRVFLDQHHAALRDELSVLQNIAQCCQGTEGELRNLLAQFLFRGDAVEQPVGNLSGGERLRAALAQAFLRAGSPELLLLDEPTNNLDAANVEYLEEVVRGFRGAVIAVSHDRGFLERCGVTEEYRLPQAQG